MYAERDRVTADARGVGSRSEYSNHQRAVGIHVVQAHFEVRA
jgi:hypothetical protein